MDHDRDIIQLKHDDSCDPGRRALILRIGDERYGLLLDKIVEVFEISTSLMKVPGSPVWVSGLVNNHGRVVPVISLRAFWKLGSEQGSRHVVLIESEEERYGLAVDKIESMDKIRVEGPEIQGRRRCWHRGALLELINSAYLTQEIYGRLKDRGEICSDF